MTDGPRSRRLTPARVPTYWLTFRFPKVAQNSVPPEVIRIERHEIVAEITETLRGHPTQSDAFHRSEREVGA